MLEVFVILGITILTSLISLAGGLLLLSGSKAAKNFQKFSMVFASLVLLYAVFGDILPEVFEDGNLPVWQVILYVALGVGLCELINILAAHFHKHGDDEKVLKNKRQATAMLIVDSLHTAVDGIVIGTSFASGMGTGIISSVATAAHEIPQEIGDFSIMIRSKMSRKKIAFLQIISALVLTPFAILAYFVGDAILPALPTLLSFIAGFFLYIVVGEIISLVSGILEKKGAKNAKHH